MWKLAIAIAIGLLIYGSAYWRGTINKAQLGLKALYWLAPYLGGLLVISYLGSFGGKHIIPFGWDFLVIAIFSVIILQLALKTHLPDIQDDFAKYKADEAATASI